jgi:hypothetical protein
MRWARGARSLEDLRLAKLRKMLLCAVLGDFELTDQLPDMALLYSRIFALAMGAARKCRIGSVIPDNKPVVLPGFLLVARSTSIQHLP